MHDVFLMMADARFAYQLPTCLGGMDRDVRRRDRRHARRVAARVRRHGRARRGVAEARSPALARDADLDIVRVGLDRWEMETTLVEFARERRLRKFQ